jgi:uncharacterized damage-inducible protein DinB
MTTYQNIGDIYDELDAVRARLTARAEALTPAQAAFRPTPDSWSPAEVIEHLSISEAGITRAIVGLLTQAEAAGAVASGFTPFSLAGLAEKAAGQKFNAPDILKPTSEVSVAEALERLRHSRAALHALRPRLEAADASAYHFPHPAFGPINGYQWLAFIGVHEARHAAQIKNILAAMPEAAGSHSA